MQDSNRKSWIGKLELVDDRFIARENVDFLTSRLVRSGLGVDVPSDFPTTKIARGVVGTCHAAPFASLNPAQRDAVISSPIMCKLCLGPIQTSAK